ncbi:hypothetical protein AHAS_Ahas10G0121500 [Arachis hypogaea]
MKYPRLLLSIFLKLNSGLTCYVCFTNVNHAFAFQLFTTITVNEPALGLKTIFNFRVPDQRSEKGLTYLQLVLSSLTTSKLGSSQNTMLE